MIDNYEKLKKTFIDAGFDCIEESNRAIFINRENPELRFFIARNRLQRYVTETAKEILKELPRLILRKAFCELLKILWKIWFGG